MKDTMTPIERCQALKAGQPVDRLPITFSHESFAAKLAGMNYREGFNTAEKAAQKEIDLYRRFGVDGISVAYTSVNFGIRFRSKIKSPADSPASIQEHVLATIDDVGELDFDQIQFKRDISQQVNYQAIEIIHQEIGAEINCTYSISGPFTIASGVIAPEKLLRAMRKKPEKVHELLRFTTECLKSMIDSVADFSFLSFFIYDPVASGSLLSPKQYAEFVQPYTKAFIDHMRKDKADRWVGMHICGDTTHSLQLIADTGIDAFSLDQKVDLAVVKAAIGDRVTLMGNVDPISIFLQGDAAAMDNAVRECYAQAFDSPKGFIIRSGCAVPYEAPVAAVEAYMAAARKYGRYPLTAGRYQ